MVLFIVVLLAGLAAVYLRLKELERRIDDISSRRREKFEENVVQELVKRVYHLEKVVDQIAAGPSGTVETAKTEPVSPTPIPPGKPQPEAIPYQEIFPGLRAVPPISTPSPAQEEYQPVAPQPIPPKPPAHAEWKRRLQEQMAGEEWESVVGGSWLNKLGVLVLVIGISLFIGYSFRYLGPPGRIAVGFIVSCVMLAGGVILERESRYMIYARGLIGGGWAALYFTTYAMHGIRAARVVQDPLVGMVSLGVAAGGMILHSLRYRSEVVTGIAYFVGFVTIAISPVSGFSAVASVPLAASLLFVANRFSWVSMAVAGVVLTYGTYALRYGVGPVTGPFPDDFVSRQSVLAIYWLLFEMFDLLDIRKRGQVATLAQTILPLNACGFLGVSLLLWSSVKPADICLFMEAAGAAYLAGAIIRSRVRPPSSFSESDDTLTRALAGGYEAGVTVAVALVIPAVFMRFSGLDINIALLLEAEFLFLAGLRLGQPYLRALGTLVFALQVVKLCSFDLATGGHLTIIGMTLMRWTPVALLTAAVLYLNRGLLLTKKESLPLLPEGYSYTASALLVLVLGAEVPPEYLGLCWLLMAIPLFEIGIWSRLDDLRFQSYGVETLSFGTLLAVNVFGAGAGEMHPWASLGATSLLTYASAVRLFTLAPGRISDMERLVVRDGCLAAGTTLLASLLWHVLPIPLVAIGWGTMSLLLTQIGISLSLPVLRLHGNLVAALTFGRLFLANFTGLGETFGISHRMLTVPPIAFLFYYLWARLRSEGKEGRLAAWEGLAYPLFLYAPAVLVVFLIRFEVGRVLAVVGWALFGLCLLFIGIRWKNRDLRWQSYILAILTFSRSWATNFYIPESLAGMFGRVFTGSVVIGSFYISQFLLHRRHEITSVSGNRFMRLMGRFDLNARAIFSVLATTLLSLLLFYEVSGSLLTVAWGIEGVVLLVAGFTTRERVLRLSGLFLLGMCILKLFVYDLRELEALPRILSFVVLGLLLLSVSLIYTRFREKIRHYL